MRIHLYYVRTNIGKTVLYTGVTNNLSIRLKQHAAPPGNSEKGRAFTHRYGCKYLIYYETFKYINNAIAREKEIKGWCRNRKLELIRTINPEYRSRLDIERSVMLVRIHHHAALDCYCSE